jgi:hypothetical protein
MLMASVDTCTSSSKTSNIMNLKYFSLPMNNNGSCSCVGFQISDSDTGSRANN